MPRNNNEQLTSGLRPHTKQSWIAGLALLATLSFAAAVPAVAQTGVLQGTVSASGVGERLQGATLNLTPANSEQKARSAVTNDQGEYSFMDLTPGEYTLQVGSDG